jgi:SAM-dependent methyltransferase
MQPGRSRIGTSDRIAITEPLAHGRRSADLTGEPPIAIPDYLAQTYTWAYLDPRTVRLLDREIVVNAILWGNYRRLVRAACAEFLPGERVLQAASVYGNQPAMLADRLGPSGQLEVIDVSPLQVENLRRKLASRPNACVRLADAAAPGRGGYDAVCCFFLLHEMPDACKRRVINALLGCVKPGGRVVFVDYAAPRWFHPLRGVMSLVNRWLEPYATSLWRNPIASFAERASCYRWKERRLFLGLYQLVVAECSAVPHSSAPGA